MNTEFLTRSYKDLARALNKNSPTILTGLGVAGLITTVIFAIKATPKALEIIEREKEFRYDEYGDGSIEPSEIVVLTWQCYIPSLVMGAATIGCIIGANHIHLRRNAALASLFSITETTLREYQAQVRETIGEKKEEMIRGEIAQKHLDETPANQQNVIITGKGDYLCFDEFSKRYFRSDIEKIRQAINEFNYRLIRSQWLSINEFYDLIGLEPIELGDEHGWMAERHILEPKFSTKLATDQEPCLVMDYITKPLHI